MSSRLPFLAALVATLSMGTGCPATPPAPAETAPAPSAAATPAASAPASAAAAPSAASAPAAADAGVGVPQLTAKPYPFPGATGNAFLDYIAFERPNRVWVPVGSTGSADVFDTTSRSFKRVDGFKTVEREARGSKRTMGPSSATAGDGVVYIGNRGTSEVCAVDSKTLALGKCVKLPVAIDGIAYVAAVKEVWVTAPKDGLLSILDASKPALLAAKTTIKVDGQPEGYAVDEAHGLFYTNYEDKGGTIAIDVKTHKITTTWPGACGADGPRGIAVDDKRGFVIVACTDHLQVLDAGHGGAKLGTLDTGAGVDNIDYAADKKLVYAAAGKAERLTIARLDDKGLLTVVATGATSPGARNPVVDASGAVYVADSAASRILVFDAPAVTP